MATPFLAWPKARHFFTAIINDIHDETKHNEVPPLPICEHEDINIAIVGAGITGLYIADQFKNYPRVKVTVLEKTDRIGGRIKTHYFQDNHDGWQYIDVGAMRIPEVHVDVLNLIKELNLPLIDYYFKDLESNLYYLNKTRTPEGKIMTRGYANDHPKEIGFVNILIPGVDGVDIHKRDDPADHKNIVLRLRTKDDVDKWSSVPNIYNAVYDKLATKLVKPGVKQDDDTPQDPILVQKFFAQYDQYSVESYFKKKIPKMLHYDCIEVPALSKVQHLVDAVLDFAECDSTSTGLNHLALTEGVMDNRHFTAKNWYTIAGGLEKLPKALYDRITQDTTRVHPVEFKLNTEVFNIQLHTTDKEGVTLHFTENGVDFNKNFDRVIMTAPFNSVRRMDVTPGFSYFKTQAIRSFNYDHSTKVCLQVPERFWEIKNDKGEVTNRGGQSRTDLPVSNVVYPCYPNKPSEAPGKGCLIASYSWQNDAVLWANMDEPSRKRMALRNIKELHGVDYKENEVEIFTQVWEEAFAMFGPGQYSEMFKAMLPEKNVHFAGEHLSTEHAWIIGCLNSAKRALREVLVLENIEDAQQSWEHFPDGDFDLDTWTKYINQVSFHLKRGNLRHEI